MNEQDRLPAFYNHANLGKRLLTGFITKTKYGRIGGGRVIPGGVYPDDIRAKPHLFICGNCRQAFTIEGMNVFCSNCSPAQLGAVATGKPAQREPVKIDISEPPATLPPPPDLTEFKVVDKKGNVIETIATVDYPSEEPISPPIENVDFGGTRKAYYVKILNENGIEYLDQAIELGYDGLIALPGIGPKTAEALLKD